MVNKQKIIQRMKEDGRVPVLWARMRGYVPATFYGFLNGRVRPTTYAARAIIADLKADGYIREEDEQ